MVWLASCRHKVVGERSDLDRFNDVLDDILLRHSGHLAHVEDGDAGADGCSHHEAVGQTPVGCQQWARSAVQTKNGLEMGYKKIRMSKVNKLRDFKWPYMIRHDVEDVNNAIFLSNL